MSAGALLKASPDGSLFWAGWLWDYSGLAFVEAAIEDAKLGAFVLLLRPIFLCPDLESFRRPNLPALVPNATEIYRQTPTSKVQSQTTLDFGPSWTLGAAIMPLDGNFRQLV